MHKRKFLYLGSLIYLGLFVVTLILNRVFLKQFLPSPMRLDFHSLWLSIVLTLALILTIYLLIKYDKIFIPKIMELLQQFELLTELTVLETIYLSLLAGIVEEFFFRGFLQPLTGIVIASLLFGAVHFLTFGYFILASAIGFYLGWALNYSDNILVPMLIHALFDIFALNYLAVYLRKEEMTL